MMIHVLMNDFTPMFLRSVPIPFINKYLKFFFNVEYNDKRRSDESIRHEAIVFLRFVIGSGFGEL